MTEKDEILKTDVLGRVKMPPEKREAILDEFERSAMSAASFARRIGVNYQTFATWVHKRRKARGQYPKLKRQAKSKEPVRSVSELALVEAVVEAPETSNGVELETASGHKIRVKSSAEITLVTELVRALEGSKAC
jgi:transposase-like protein